MHGMLVTEMRKKWSVLVFRCKFLLDEQGMQAQKTTVMFNIFKHLVQVLSENIIW
ncbi:DUF2498 family protein [Sodalis sp.]|uniref:DUF2498 family protein n=1 Tax=Sodalis sp. (in: enterobacteria) TaxID=1898979 RepID=UPI0038736ADE